MKDLNSYSISELKAHLDERENADAQLEKVFVLGVARQMWNFTEGNRKALFRLLASLSAELTVGDDYRIRPNRELCEKFGLK